MDILLVILQAVVVLGAIVMGVRTGGVGLGLWGVAGTLVLVFVFHLAPGSPPVDAFFIVIAVITAASAMQAAGGIDYLVSIASKIIQASPSRLTYVAPLVSFVFTALAGTSNIYFALIPVIYETAYRNGQRPERSLAASTVTSALGITASPVSAAMAAYLVLMTPLEFSLVDILIITIPASIAACIVTSIVQQRLGRELLDDEVFLARVEAGTVEMPQVLAAQQAARADAVASGMSQGKAARHARKSAATGAERAERIHIEVPPGGAAAAWIFIAAVLIIVTFGLFSGLRPAFPTGENGQLVPVGMSVLIQMFMFTAALVIILVRKVPPGKIVEQPLLKAGFVAAVALFGIAWMADTFIKANQETIIDPLGDLVTSYPILLAVALFLVCGLTTSQSATTNTIVPIAIAAGMTPGVITAMWPSLVGVWLFPANGSQIAAVETDLTGSTKLTTVPVWHSFTIPMLVSWVTVVAVGMLIQLFVH
ncbi:anaerobic C4-dicarboxylate transporter [Microbacterium fluvii]|uniref:Anaerobic C4-dicarboxylate transporter n=1 Tax=Microbacterium fluvii TaxID=415215 RepID=A0ABW2HI52_9MICO|nr:anaerobic C4-dicarboxylate transporter [Microbacterium fluvii]MCU4673157.1 anaerobic C4-dicarboxylate transporter [Microbacterium fluvii]